MPLHGTVQLQGLDFFLVSSIKINIKVSFTTVGRRARLAVTVVWGDAAFAEELSTTGGNVWLSGDELASQTEKFLINLIDELVVVATRSRVIPKTYVITASRAV